MGADHSKYEGEPENLESLDLKSVAKYMKSKRCKNVFVMLGAGVSTSAGIPDFRSPETGLYANLARLNLPTPEAVFEINFFRENPVPFYTLALELLPGRFRPTLTHSFVRLLASHNLLRLCFTQNIDTLERRAGVPGDLIVEAHGSFASQRCIDCKSYFDAEEMREHIKQKKIARCPECEGLVKPDIVFFGESLPPLFHSSIHQLRQADLLFVIGTSLTVQPFASLTSLVPEHCPRVLINLDEVGDFGSRSDDVIALGKCDDVVRELCKELGWEEELDAAWKETENSVVEFDTTEKGHPSLAQTRIDQLSEEIDSLGEFTRNKADLEEERLEKEVDRITEKIEEALEIGTESKPLPSSLSSASTDSPSPTTGEEVPVLNDVSESLETDDKKGESGTVDPSKL